MKNIFVCLSLLYLAIFFYSCEGNGAEIKGNLREMEINRIDSLEKVLQGMQLLNVPLGNTMIKAYGAFATAYPGDSLAPEYLFKAADIAQGIQKGDIAYTNYQRIHSHYPKYKKARLSLFLQGYVAENQLGDTAMARHIYGEVMKAKSDDDLAMQARACILNLGKSPEELVKGFEKMNKEKK